MPGAIEVRRTEGGIRTWAAEPGEYYHAFDGAYGGLWRRSDRPPQTLCGIGFTSQGTFVGDPTPPAAARDNHHAWIFDGVKDELFGGYGFSGGGAAGFELDRLDHRLGSPLNAVVLASSEGHDRKNFVAVHEERLGLDTTIPGETLEQLIRADMTYSRSPRAARSSRSARSPIAAPAQQVRQRRVAAHLQRAQPLRRAGQPDGLDPAFRTLLLKKKKKKIAEKPANSGRLQRSLDQVQRLLSLSPPPGHGVSSQQALAAGLDQVERAL